jgi:hypothetical protein
LIIQGLLLGIPIENSDCYIDVRLKSGSTPFSLSYLAMQFRDASLSLGWMRRKQEAVEET